MTLVLRAMVSPNPHNSGELAVSLLYEALARERMRDHERLIADARTRQVIGRLAAARRLQRRAESASRRARALLLSL